MRQLREILWCKRHVDGFGVSDYFDQRLFEADRDLASMTSFAGWRMEAWLDDRLNPIRWRGLAEDKLVTYAILHSADLPYPRIRALFHPLGRTYQGAPTFSDTSSMANHIRNDLRGPCFVKPIFGALGGGAKSLIGFDSATDRALLGDGSDLPVEDFCRQLLRPKPGVVVSAGYMFQELVRQHAAVEAVCGKVVSTVRVVVVMLGGSPRIHRTIWRIGVGSNLTDNFDKGRSGNLLAAVDPMAGTVCRVVKGYGVSQQVVESHPDTAANLANIQLPLWDEIRDLCLRSARAFPMLRFQHWDVAIGLDGPLILELNTTGGIHILQYAGGEGLNDGPLRLAIDEPAMY